MQSENLIFLCFPGFLGLPSDFEQFRSLAVDLEVIDVCGCDAPNVGESWIEWQQRLFAVLDWRYSGRSVVIIGYSMGARICLGILREKPSWVRSAILMSCNPGLKILEEREERLKSDIDWARRFREEPWEPLLKAWNQQTALANTKVLRREEREFDRVSLARSLEVFSLGQQEQLTASSINIPSLICWGEKDAKFKSLVPELIGAFTQASSCEVPYAGHRVHVDNSAYLSEYIRDFIVSQAV